jgi:signal transduction histidine kinase
MKRKVEVVDFQTSAMLSVGKPSLPKTFTAHWQLAFLLTVTVLTLPLSGEQLPIPAVMLASLVLGAALLIPWGVKEQGLICGVAGASYLITAHSDGVLWGVEAPPYELIGLGVSLGVSLIGVSWRQTQRTQVAEQTAALQQRIQEAEALQEFSRALTSTLSCSQLLPPLTAVAQRLCQVQGLVVGVFLQEGQEVELWTQTDPVLHEQRLPVEPLLMKEILQVGWPVFIPDIGHPPVTSLLCERLAAAGFASLLVVPLRAVHRVIGVLLVGWRAPYTSLTRHQEELLQLIADQTVQALSNIRLYQEQERHLSESESLRRVGQLISATLNLQDILKLVTEEGARLLGGEAGMLTWCTPEQEVEIAGASDLLAPWRGVRIPFADSVTALVMQERRAICMEDVREKNLFFLQRLREAGKPVPRAFLAVPLWQAEQPVGALSVLSTKPRIFSLNDERILQALADQAVHAINNAQLYERLQDSLQREQKVGRQKSAFFASASHELRTPLNIILGYIDLIREGVIGQIDAEVAETLGRARDAAHHMIALVNDLLDLACIERAELQLHPQLIDLEELLQDVCATWEKPIKEKGLAFQRVGGHSLPPLMTDKARLRQILDNLLGNAVKFTETGSICVGARVYGQSIEIWVEDTGIGIDPLHHEKIFDEFQQIENANTNQFEGFGLGLAVCKKIAHLLQGDICVESTVGRGSRFTLTLACRHF